MKRKFIAVGVVIAAAVVTNIPPANAGGLFGKGGVIRGDVGNFLDKNVEGPILTPAARGATVGATTAVVLQLEDTSAGRPVPRSAVMLEGT
jgi:hypothetical protein